MPKSRATGTAQRLRAGTSQADWVQISVQLPSSQVVLHQLLNMTIRHSVKQGAVRVHFAEVISKELNSTQ